MSARLGKIRARWQKTQDAPSLLAVPFSTALLVDQDIPYLISLIESEAAVRAVKDSAAGPTSRLRAAAQRYRDARQALGGAQREYRLRGEARAVSQEYIDSRDALIEAALAEAGAAGDGAFPPTAICVCTCRGDEHETRWEGDRFVGTRCEAHGGHKFALVAETSEQA